jgi:hypothetical protein
MGGGMNSDKDKDKDKDRGGDRVRRVTGGSMKEPSLKEQQHQIQQQLQHQLQQQQQQPSKVARAPVPRSGRQYHRASTGSDDVDLAAVGAAALGIGHQGQGQGQGQEKGSLGDEGLQGRGYGKGDRGGVGGTDARSICTYSSLGH